MSGVRTIERCRFCDGALSIPFCDLGTMPLANAYVPRDRAGEPEPTFPLSVRVCERCFLAQLTCIVDPTSIFADYAYFSSWSSSWLDHARRFARDSIARFGLGPRSFVVEVASNDGYLLRNFVEAGIPCLGIEPARNVAAAAVAAGVPTEALFFGLETANGIVDRRGPADLVVANNVLAHVPDINDFVAGLARLAGTEGVVVIEAPHLLELVAGVQFDTIYHEHYAYWSLHAMEKVLGAHGLAVFRVEKLATHGGSLRVYAAAAGRPRTEPSGDADPVRAREQAAGIARAAFYEGFQQRVRAVCDPFRSFLDSVRNEGKVLAGYGAAAKGNTFLNACGVHFPDLAFVADRNPVKQGTLLPGSAIPVTAPAHLFEARPDFVLILPWNLRAEIAGELAGIGRWGGRFVVAVPELAVFGPPS